ncbi:MAG: gluconeogenesis factor YvcK family protein [Caldilineaceae bacterium]
MLPKFRPSTSLQTDWPRALRPGLGLKRWLLVIFIGVIVTGLGGAFFIRELYLDNEMPAFVYWLSLRWLPDWLRGLLLLTAGLTLILYALLRLNESLMTGFLQQEVSSRQVMQTLLQRQQRRQGPKIVAIGGGTGMPQLLRGLRAYTDNITAIVTVADDGGSSGKLRRQMRVLPPGDFRNNIAALSEAEGLMTRLLQYRFPEVDITANPEQINGHGSGLSGHSFGNLFIATMAAVTGSFESGIAESSRVLAVRGRILPSTLEEITLCAEVQRNRVDEAGESQEEWITVEGESNIPEAGGKIERVFLKPENPRAYPEALRAILHADLIVAGPGSFFTSVMANLLVPAVRDALLASPAPCLYLCNLVTQPGETDDFTVTDHLTQLHRHIGDVFNNVLANSNYDPNQQPSPHSQWVTLPEAGETLKYRLFTGDLVDAQRPWRHDPAKLAGRIMQVYEELHK